jgi:hypothetical protein
VFDQTDYSPTVTDGALNAPDGAAADFSLDFMHKPILSLALLCAASLLLTPTVRAADAAPASGAAKPAATAAAPANDTVVAKGKGVQITRGQLEQAVQSFKANAAAQGRTIAPEQMAMVEPGLLDRLIQTQLLLSKATDAEKAKAKEEALQHLQEAKTNAPSEEMFNAQLKATGLTMDQLVKNLTEQATAEAVVERELKISVTDADVKKFYNDTNNAANFEQPEMVRASHIL